MIRISCFHLSPSLYVYLAFSKVGLSFAGVILSVRKVTHSPSASVLACWGEVANLPVHCVRAAIEMNALILSCYCLLHFKVCEA